MSVSIDVDNVIKKYEDTTVINGLSLKIHPGEFFTLLGPSGCGKTTLLRMIIGFNSIEGGTIKVDGKVINDIPVNKRNMGMVFQNYALYPHLTVLQNIIFPLQNLKGEEKMTKEAMCAKALEVAKLVQIDELMERKPSELSGGQQQRVAIARALANNPSLLLADEPTAALDSHMGRKVMELLKNVAHTHHTAVLVVTHDHRAIDVFDRIWMMEDGKLSEKNWQD